MNNEKYEHDKFILLKDIIISEIKEQFSDIVRYVNVFINDEPRKKDSIEYILYLEINRNGYDIERHYFDSLEDLKKRYDDYMKSYLDGVRKMIEWGKTNKWKD